MKYVEPFLYGLMVMIAAGFIGVTLAELNKESVRIPYCETEDQTTNCFWDAQLLGNGEGESFFQYGGKRYGINGGTS